MLGPSQGRQMQAHNQSQVLGAHGVVGKEYIFGKQLLLCYYTYRRMVFVILFWEGSKAQFFRGDSCTTSSPPSLVGTCLDGEILVSLVKLCCVKENLKGPGFWRIPAKLIKDYCDVVYV